MRDGPAADQGPAGEEAGEGRADEDAPPSKALARPLLIGLTGPIGCGKSTIAGWLARRGGAVVDADALAREVTAPGQPGHEAILGRFGDAVRRADGTLDRAALGRQAFGDAAALGDLEGIVHPLVRPRILDAIERAQISGAPFVVLEAIKLVEAGYAAMCDEVWLVRCPRADQLRRLEARGLTPADARQRADAQRNLAERLAPAATWIVDTEGSRDAARRRVARALNRALADARSQETVSCSKSVPQRK